MAMKHFFKNNLVLSALIPQIIDAEGKILSQNDYHYKNQ